MSVKLSRKQQQTEFVVVRRNEDEEDERGEAGFGFEGDPSPVRYSR